MDDWSDVRPSGGPLGRAFAVNPGPFNEELLDVIRVAASVHGDGPLPTIPLRFSTALGQVRGRFRFDHSGPISILVNYNLPHRMFAAIHEIGHFIDYSGIGEPNLFASESPTELTEWRAAIDANSRTHQLRKAVDALARRLPPERKLELVEALLPTELWARCYAQYVTTVSGHSTLTASLDALRAKTPRDLTGIGHLLHWEDEDFGPIASAIERLFRRLGWRSVS